MITSSKHQISLKTIAKKHKKFDRDWGEAYIIEVLNDCIDAQIERNTNTAKIGCIQDRLKKDFPTFNAKELRVVSKNVSRYFMKNKWHSRWEVYHKYLPLVWAGVKTDLGNGSSYLVEEGSNLSTFIEPPKFEIILKGSSFNGKITVDSAYEGQVIAAISHFIGK